MKRLSTWQHRRDTVHGTRPLAPAFSLRNPLLPVSTADWMQLCQLKLCILPTLWGQQSLGEENNYQCQSSKSKQGRFKFNHTKLTESRSQFSPISCILLQQHVPLPLLHDPQSNGDSPALLVKLQLPRAGTGFCMSELEFLLSITLRELENKSLFQWKESWRGFPGPRSTFPGRAGEHSDLIALRTI